MTIFYKAYLLCHFSVVKSTHTFKKIKFECKNGLKLLICMFQLITRIFPLWDTVRDIVNLHSPPQQSRSPLFSTHTHPFTH